MENISKMKKTIFLALSSLLLASQVGLAAATTTPSTKKTQPVTTAVHSKSTKARSTTASTSSNKSTSNNKKATTNSKSKATPKATKKTGSSKNSSSHYSRKSRSHNHSAKHHAPQGNVEAMADSEGEALTGNPEATATTASDEASSSDSFTHRMVAMVEETVSNLRYSVYKLGGTHFDASKGVYMVDCSDYVDHLLHDSSPRAYTSLANWSGSYKPTSEHYYSFFTQRLAAASDPNWQKIDDTQNLQAGDILVLRYKNSRGRGAGGHVMVVMDKPSGNDNVMEVRVADSASSGHGDDTRPLHTSGIGIGTMLLKVNPQTGQPFAYAWKAGAPWKSNVKIAMGRPTGTA